MKKSRGIAGLLGTILMIALLAYTVSFGWGGSHSGAMKNIKLGLDLARRGQYHLSDEGEEPVG